MKVIAFEGSGDYGTGPTIRGAYADIATAGQAGVMISPYHTWFGAYIGVWKGLNMDPDAARRVFDTADEMLRACAGLGGSLKACHEATLLLATLDEPCATTKEGLYPLTEAGIEDATAECKSDMEAPNP